MHDGLEHRHVASSRRAFSRYGKPVPISAPSRRHLLAHANAPAVELRAVAARGRVELLAHRVVHDARARGGRGIRRAIDTAKTGKPCRKLVVPSSGSMIQTNSSPPLRPLSSPRNPWSGCSATDRLDDLALRHLVDFRHEIVAALRAHAERRHAVDVADDEVASASRRANGDIQQWLHERPDGRLGWKERQGRGPARGPVEYQSMSIRIVLVAPRIPATSAPRRAP